MPYRRLINIDKELKNSSDLPELINNREPAIQKLVDDFKFNYGQKYGFEIQSIDDIARKISSVYFSMCYAHVKPAVEDKTNKFKMASLMELIIVQEQVLFHPDFDEQKTRELNADFGIVAAFSLIDCMISHSTQEVFCNTVNNPFNDKIDSIIDGHRTWLITKQLTEMPILLNSQFYEMMEAFQTMPVQQNGS
jgi:hypothetical protein